jgi:serine/threonine protein kinase/DNA-binding beta-propeller fold protein YncE
MLAELQSGDPPRIGPYRLISRLGSGGMGRVYLGRSAGGRPVAVKVIRPELAADPEFRARFQREVAAAQRVNGLYTALVVDADVDSPLPWLATAYVAGASLADAVATHGPLPEESVQMLAAGLAEGLAAIHAAGLVHRDLKPSNVLLADDGPRVIDFGISRAAEATALTHAGLVLGSSGFMSPEQAEGREVGPPSDMFSLGAVLTFAATGRGPFGTGSTAALVYRLVHMPPSLDGVPGPIRALVERCMDKDPGRRPTAGDLLAELGDTDIGTGWLPTQVHEEPPRPAPDVAAVDPAGTGDVPDAVPAEADQEPSGIADRDVPAVVDSIQEHLDASGAFTQSRVPGRPQDDLERPEDQHGRDRLPEADVTGEFYAAAEAGRATSEIETGPATGQSEITTDAEDRQPADRRGLLARIRGARRRTIVIAGVAAALIAAAAATTPLYLGHGNSELPNLGYAVPALRVEGVIDQPGGEQVAAVAYSPNGQMIATGDNAGNIDLWRAASRQLITSFADPSSQGVFRMAFSPDGSILATADWNGHAYLWDVTTHALLATLSVPGGGRATGVAFSPDGKTVAVADDDGYLWDVATHRQVATFRPPAGNSVFTVAFSPDGQILAAGGGNTTYLWNITTRTVIATLNNPNGDNVTAITFTPGGATVITSYIEGYDDAFLWNAATGRLVTKLSSAGRFVGILGASLSRDGRFLAVAEQNGPNSYDRIWQVASRRLVGSFTAPANLGTDAVAFSPDGKTVAASVGPSTYLLAAG